MVSEPRIRVSALLLWQDRILLCRHEKPGKEYWLLPGGGVNSGESLVDALRRELSEEVGIEDRLPIEGPIAIVDSISPARARRRSTSSTSSSRPISGAGRSRRSRPPMRRCAATGCSGSPSSNEIVLHPPIQRFLARWQPGDPTVYLGPLWAP